ncbi:hypothetical protein HAX54_010760 [Datura stramonium]|uniref:Uncharacterized protein n=1 Tax=Datura stramonium TaxID=4076 RepID=A0ABS8RIC2_DATST|nr:hypothetical protein [Datura stramonium]
MSVSSHPIGQSDGSPGNKDDMKISKTTEHFSGSPWHIGTPKIVTSLGPVRATTIMPAAVPQARKASLARFLEKRKERSDELSTI